MIRKLLLTIRRYDARLNDVQKIAVIVLSIILIAVGVVVDIFAPFNFWINTIRAIIALANAILIFSILYILSVNSMYRRMDKDANYKPIRQRMTYLERRNLSIFFGIGLFIILLMSSQHTPAYTFINSGIFVGVIAIFAFLRTSRDEFLRDKYGVPDSRQIAFNKQVEEKVRERQTKWQEKKDKKAEKDKNKIKMP
jgi:L-asparagine transporter-like permease